MVHAQARICLGEWDAQSSLGFLDTNGQTTRPRDSQQKREPAELWNLKSQKERKKERKWTNEKKW